MADVPDNPIPVSAAAKAAGVPERSLFRAVEKGRVPTTKREGVTLVAVPDVQAWAERRAAAKAAAATGAAPATATAGSLPAAPAMAAGGGSRFGRDSAPLPDGVLAAEVFEAFEAGKSPSEVVQDLELPPKVVLDLHRQHEELLTAAGPKGPTASERIDELVARVGQLEAIAMRLDIDVASLKADVSLIGAHLHDLPIPPRNAVTCDCGARGYVETYLRCSCCGKQMTWGFQPPKQ